jgi:hypothetical protein
MMICYMVAFSTTWMTLPPSLLTFPTMQPHKSLILQCKTMLLCMVLPIKIIMVYNFYVISPLMDNGKLWFQKRLLMIPFVGITPSWAMLAHLVYMLTFCDPLSSSQVCVDALTCTSTHVMLVMLVSITKIKVMAKAHLLH